MTTSRFCPHCGADNLPSNALCHACQQPLATPTNAEEASELLNERYAVLAEVGAGGFGAVYRARDTREQDRLVAVKQINLKGLSAQEIIETTDAFNREAQILTALSHPLLPRIFDRFSDPEHWYLVMNFIDGSTLDEYLQQHATNTLPGRAGLPLEETLTIGLNLCDVLHYLHTQQPPVIFRDIKPGNIMRTPGGQLYLIDFGIARHFKPGQAKDTIPFGSPGFAAPEQYGRAQTTPQADIYSLGALLYCLISGDDPADHPFQFPSLRLYGIDGIRELDTLIQHMVALDPLQRPADIHEVREELLAIRRIHTQANKQHIWLPPQGQTPPTASTFGQQHIFSSTNIVTRKTSRRRVVTAALVVGGAALIGGIATALGSHQGPVSSSPGNAVINTDTPNATDTATATATDTATATATDTAQTALPTFWSPDLSHSAALNVAKNRIEIYEDQGKRLVNTVQPPNISDSSIIQWSPDNNRIVILDDPAFDGNNNSSVWDVNSGQHVFTLPASSPILQQKVVWSPNSKYLATSYSDVTNNNITVFALFDTNNGKPLIQRNFSDQAVTSMGWTMDSRYVLFPVPRRSASDINGTWTLEVWNSQTQQKIGAIDGPNTADLNTGVNIIPIIACSPSSNQIAFTYQNFIWLAKLADAHSIHQLTNFADGATLYSSDFSSLVWSPNEQYLAILVQNNLSIWNVSNGQSVQLGANNSQDNINTFSWSANSKIVTVVDNANVISQWSVG